MDLFQSHQFPSCGQGRRDSQPVEGRQQQTRKEEVKERRGWCCGALGLPCLTTNLRLSEPWGSGTRHGTHRAMNKLCSSPESPSPEPHHTGAWNRGDSPGIASRLKMRGCHTLNTVPSLALLLSHFRLSDLASDGSPSQHSFQPVSGPH